MERSQTAAAAIGYHVRKDIRNRPLREIDRAGQRRMWGSGVVALVVLALLMTAAWIKITQTDIGYQIAALEEESRRLETERRHWLAELESLRAPRRIEALATEGLHLVRPAAKDVVVIEQARGAAAPSSAVVASR